jgi:hypothetical protein
MRRDEVGWSPGPLEIIEMTLDDLDDPRLQPAHPAYGELRSQQPPQPGVLRRVESQQLTGPPLRDLVFAELRAVGGNAALALQNRVESASTARTSSYRVTR